MSKARKLRYLILTALLLALSSVKATALVAEPALFGAAVAEKWRDPLARFLNELGVADIDATISASRAGEYPDETGPARIIFRIVHPHACVRERDECMTTIGHLDDGIFIAEAMFYAGDKITVGDVSPRILGVQSAKPVSFVSKTSAVSVVKTAKGFLIVSQPKK